MQNKQCLLKWFHREASDQGPGVGQSLGHKERDTRLQSRGPWLLWPASQLGEPPSGLVPIGKSQL